MSRPLKNSTFRQLATFSAVARLGSVSRAAEEIHLTQQAVSMQIGQLENAAGTPLLARGNRGIKLTDAGGLLANYAIRILELWQEAGDAMALHKGEVAGLLRVGAVTTGEYLLPPLLLEFVREHPQVRLKLHIGNRADIVTQLANQDIDLAIMGRPPAELNTQAITFAKHPMAFVAAPTHPLMKAVDLDLAKLGQANLLVRERGSGTRTALELLFKDAGTTLSIGAEMSSNVAIKHMCAGGYGIAFMSVHACAAEIEAGVLAVLPMAKVPIERDWRVIRLAGRPVPAAATAFEQFLSTQGQTHVRQQLEKMYDSIRRTHREGPRNEGSVRAKELFETESALGAGQRSLDVAMLRSHSKERGLIGTANAIAGDARLVQDAGAAHGGDAARSI
jgi:LysR family transcriptional regulator, low CO2-responsive transcriptional regulator